MRLTDKTIQALTYDENGPQRIRDDSVPGFGIVVGKRTKSFFVMYGEGRNVKTLGRYPDISLKEARREAVRYLSRPTPLRRSMSRNELVRAFLDHCEGTLRAGTVRRYKQSYRKKEPQTPQDIAAFKALYNWGLRNNLVEENPYRYHQATFTQRDRVLSDEEVCRIWQHERPPFSDIVKLLILTGQRRSQYGAFEQSWVQGDEIHFPSLIMKSKRSHAIPLTPLARTYVERLTPFNGWGKSKARLDRESGVTGWVLHDTRRYFSSTMARLGVSLHITEHLLDHRSSTSGVQAIYMRYGFLTEMREALQIYEEHLRSVIAQGSQP